MAARSWRDAFEVARPMIADRPNKTSDGAVLFAVWATKRMVWTDVNVLNDETSLALVRKDVDEARGKRMCWSGAIIQIATDKFDDGRAKIYIGLMQTGAGDLIHFLAAGSSGTLVERSSARYCGVVTGVFDYTNSAGGTGHAVELVGMFDLPENKPKGDAGAPKIGGR